MDNLNEFLTNLRKKKYTLDKIAELIPVSKQGYFNWEKGHRDWKLDVLIKLSAILNFELKIANGELFIKENVKMIEKSIKRKNENGYEIVEDFKKFSIVKLYTSRDNIQDDNLSLVEDFVFKTVEDCKEFFGDNCDIVSAFGLFNKDTCYICNSVHYTRDLSYIYTMYYLHYAPVLSITEKGYEVVKILDNYNTRIVKAYGKLTIKSNDIYYFSSVQNYPSKDTLNGFIALDENENIIDKIEPFYLRINQLIKDIEFLNETKDLI